MWLQIRVASKSLVTSTKSSLLQDKWNTLADQQECFSDNLKCILAKKDFPLDDELFGSLVTVSSLKHIYLVTLAPRLFWEIRFLNLPSIARGEQIQVKRRMLQHRETLSVHCCHPIRLVQVPGCVYTKVDEAKATE